MTPYTPTWHALEESEERAWLDQWARLHLIPVTQQPRPTAPTALAIARSH